MIRMMINGTKATTRVVLPYRYTVAHYRKIMNAKYREFIEAKQKYEAVYTKYQYKLSKKNNGDDWDDY